MRRYQLLCAVLGTVVFAAQAQTTSLRQERIFEGDIAQLTIEHDAAIPSLYAIDTSPLETDFKVLDVQSRISRHFGENQTFHRMQWVIQMVPRHGGSISVPPLKFGGHHSEAILLRVDRARASIRARENVYIEMEVIPENPYPGQQVRVTTRLFHNLPLRRADLSEPHGERVTIFRSGKDSRFTLLRAGESFDVLERSILLTADASGPLPVTAASFRGLIGSGPDLAERYIYRQGTDLQFEVREKPPDFGDRPWLPAQQLELSLIWDKPAGKLKTGDSLGVTLDLEATGLPAEALPADLLVTASRHYKIYADEAVRNTEIVSKFDGEHFIGRLRQRFVVITQQPGKLVIPELALTWWDIEQDVARTARIESRIIQVEPIAAAGNASGATEARSGVSARGMPPAFIFRHWPWLTALAAILSLATVLVFAGPLRERIGAKLALAGNRRRCRSRLRRACYAGDAGAARQALIEWGRLHWGEARICGLHHIDARTGSTQLAEELARLDAALFAGQGNDWRGEGLWRMLGQTPDARYSKLQKEIDLLPGPYPQRA
jgi:hypothetical protein